MNRRTLLFLTLVAAVCGSPATPRAQDQPIVATITDTTPVTLLPDAARTPLATLHEGTQVKVLGPAEEGWYRISFQDNYLFGDRVGYVRVEYLRLPGASANPPPPRQVAVDGVSATGRPEGTVLKHAPAIGRGSLNGLSPETIATAIAAARRDRGNARGLRLLDTGQPWTDVVPRATESSSTVRLQVFTPLAWIQQQASDAAREARGFGVADVTDAMTQPVLRITAFSNLTNAAAAAGRTRRPWVRHVILRGTSRTAVVQPLSKEAYSEHLLNAGGGEVVLEGLRLTFPMDAVRKLRGPRGDGEFVIAVIGPSGEEKALRITRQYFSELPM